MQDAYISAKRAAEICGVSVKTIWNWCREGKVKASKIGGKRNIRIKYADLIAYMDSCSNRPGDGGTD